MLTITGVIEVFAEMTMLCKQKGLAGLLLICLGLLLLQVRAADSSGTALLLEVKGAIGPATSEYIESGLQRAQSEGARLVILRMDTPGGLDTSMRAIIKSIIQSPVPVATYVAPGGSRAASAGTYILYASHIAAMAPGTNLGAATPVQLIGGGEPAGEDKNQKDSKQDQKPKPTGGSAMQKKMINDAVAYIRSLAEMRGRNADWAEQAVREAESLQAQEALKLNVIDFVAKDVQELLIQADGREVKVGGEVVVLDTAQLQVITVEPNWRERLLAVITDPNIAYILMLVGIYGLIFEFMNPGYVLPGVAGAIALVLALYAFQVLPINYAGVGLILLGIIFMAAEAFVPSFGALGFGGLAAFVIGSIILVRTESEFYTISRPLIFAVALVSAGFLIGILGVMWRARRGPVVSGSESLIGSPGEVVEEFGGHGRVRAQGEVWRAESDTPLKKGQKVRVVALSGLTVKVQPIEQEGGLK